MIIIKETSHVAKKQHICEWCGEVIEKGTRYHYYAGPYDGRFQSTCVHTECYDAMQEEAAYWGGDYEFFPHMNERPDKEGE